MGLQGRNLSLNMRGPDVDLLLQELRALHFDIAADETGFGQATLKAVAAVQRQEGLAPTGIVDQATAAVVKRRFHELADSGVVTGVVASESGEPPVGARVEAPDLGFSAQADEAGRYEIGSVAPGQVRLRASAAEYVPQEAEVVVEAGSAVEHDFTLSPTPGGDLIVRGQVRHEDSRQVVNATVRAFDRDLRRVEPLGDEATPDAAGRYEIRYTSDQFARAEKDGADLILRLFGPDRRELAASPVLFNAPAWPRSTSRSPPESGSSRACSRRCAVRSARSWVRWRWRSSTRMTRIRI
jgi:peptidoglycan hydrolase-like protein with peptidoglycan-binding domain